MQASSLSGTTPLMLQTERVQVDPKDDWKLDMGSSWSTDPPLCDNIK